LTLADSVQHCNRMAAIAVFTSASGSHPFLERRVVLSEPAKIGRSVAQAKPSPSNTIFDCKVLSRNHAILWYETGKVCIQDCVCSYPFGISCNFVYFHLCLSGFVNI